MSRAQVGQEAVNYYPRHHLYTCSQRRTDNPALRNEMEGRAVGVRRAVRRFRSQCPPDRLAPRPAPPRQAAASRRARNPELSRERRLTGRDRGAGPGIPGHSSLPPRAAPQPARSSAHLGSSGCSESPWQVAGPAPVSQPAARRCLCAPPPPGCQRGSSRPGLAEEPPRMPPSPGGDCGRGGRARAGRGLRLLQCSPASLRVGRAPAPARVSLKPGAGWRSVYSPGRGPTPAAAARPASPALAWVL